MKTLKIIFVILLALLPILAAAQDSTSFGDLTPATVRNNADQFVIVQPDSARRMTTNLLLQDVNSDISDNATDISTNEVDISSNDVAISSNTGNIATNTAHGANTSNPHSVTLEQLLSPTGNTGKVIKSNGSAWYAGDDETEGSGSSTSTTTDTVIEATAGHGILLDGIKLKDYFVELYEISTPAAPAANFGRLYFDAADEKLKLRTSSTIYDLTETGSAGSSDSSWVSLTTGLIYERTAGAGVSIDGALIKDGGFNLASGGAGLFWGTNTGIYEGVGDQIYYQNAGSNTAVLTTSTFAPLTTSTLDLGSATLFFDDAHINRINIQNTGAYIDYSGSNLRFTDPTTGTKTLAELASGGGSASDSSWTSITTDTIHEYSAIGIFLDATGPITIDSYNSVSLAQSGSNKFISSMENWSLVDMKFSTGTEIKTSTSNGNTLSLSAYDVDGAADTPMITLTAGNTPTMTFPQSGGGTTNFLRADGAWAAPSGGGSTDSSWTSITTDTINVVSSLRVNSSSTRFAGTIRTVDGGGFLNTTASLTNPTIWTTSGYSASGFGGLGHDVSIIRNGANLLQTESGGISITGTLKTSGIPEAITDEFMFYNKATGAFSYGDTAGFGGGGGGSSYWDRTGTDLSPTNSGDDMLLAVSSESIKWGDGDTHLYETSDDILDITVGASLLIRYEIGEMNLNGNFLPTGSARDIGNGSNFWDDGFFGKIYFGTTSADIELVDSELEFTDGVTGTKTLAELASGGSDLGDTITTLWEAVFEDTVALGEVAPIHSDTSTRYTFGGYDFATDIVYGSFYNSGSDTLYVIEVNGVMDGGSPSLTIDIKWDTDFTAAGATHLWATPPTQTTTGSFISNTSFTNRKIPPKYRVWMTTPTMTTAPDYGEWSLITTTLSGGL